MELTFTNGTSEQQQLWRGAFDLLLNLPVAAIPLSIEVTFEDPAAVGGLDHNDFAITAWNYGDTGSVTKVRDDLPGFDNLRATMEAEAAKLGIDYTPEQFTAECAAHELGHSYFAALPQPAREEIAQMFGAATDDFSELSAGDDWQDRIIEGIAETFKDAFLPRRYRVFPNRTRRTISYAEFPRFRELFRSGSEEVGVGGEEDLEVDLIEDLQDDLNNPISNPQYESRADTAQEIKVATDFEYEMTVPRDLFPEKAIGKKAEQIISGHIQFALRVTDFDTEEVIHFARGAWLFGKNSPAEHDPLIWDEELFQFRFAFPDPPNVEESDDTSEGGENHWNLYAEEANALGIPDFTITHSFSVPAGKTIVVQAFVLLYGWQSEPENPEFPLNELEPERLKQFEELMPHLIYKEGAGGTGTPIERKVPSLTPGPEQGGPVPSRHPVYGQ